MTAQTNLQLYEELLALAWEDRALEHVRSAYELALELHTGQIRSSGKPFIAHLVGTASILAETGKGPTMVAAGLLHAAYARGAFGGWRHPPRPRHRRELADWATADVERLVSRYTTLPWDAASIAHWSGAPASLASLDADVARIRLANELEEHLSRAKVFTGRARVNDEEATSLLALAHGLGEVGVAAGLAQAFETGGPPVPAALTSAYAHKLRTPRTHRRRVSTIAVGATSAVRAAVRVRRR